MATPKQFFNSLKTFFNISQKKLPGYDDPVPVPGSGENSKGGGNRPLPMDDELLRLYNFWLKDTYDTSQTLKDRFDRYSSLQYAYYNSPIISATIDLYADEVTQVDAQTQLIEVEAKDKKVEKFINEFFERIGVTQKKIRDIAWNVTLYGDAFWVVASSVEEGINEVIPIEPFSVMDRMEFNAIEAEKRISKNRKGIRNFLNKSTNLQAIQKMMDSNSDDLSRRFKNYLFGFQIEKTMFPPWNVLHFRAFTTQSEFYPFGRPILINSLAPFRQLQASKNLMALGRASAFNLKHFQVKTDENATWEDKWEAVNETRQQFHNLGNEPSGKEQFTINSEIWTPEDLLTVDSIESRFDADKIGDVEMLRDDLIMGTRIPKGYLVVDRASFGTSGQALLQQHKPFARGVYSIQSAILEQLTQLVRIQMVMTGAFDPDEANFQLKMAFPQVEESQDRVRNKSDLLRLAKDIIDNIGEALGLDRGEALPPEVVKQILSQISFLDQEDIDSWVDATISAQQPESEDDDLGLGEGWINQRVIRGKKLETIKERLNDSPGLVNECEYFVIKRNGMMEGIANHRHYYTSYQSDPINSRIVAALKMGGRESKQSLMG